MNLNQDVINAIQSHGIPFERNTALKEFSWFKSGGTVGMVIHPETVEQLISAVAILKKHAMPYKVIGETSNLMFLDDCDYTCLICTRRMKHLNHDSANRVIEVDAGVMLPDLSRFALAASVGGYAGFEGIPGTIGGAVFMNAGAYGFSINQVLIEVDVLQPDGKVETLPADVLGLKHRDSVFKQGSNTGLILRARFRADPGNQSEIYGHMELFHAKRHKYLEYMYPNLGSLFAGSVYRALGEHDLYYKIVSSAFMAINYRFKPFRRESPLNRKWLNDFTVKRFGLKFERQPFSDKTINMLINNGHHTKDHLTYIEQLRSLIGSKVPIENEIVEPF